MSPRPTEVLTGLRLPDAPKEYNKQAMDRLLRALDARLDLVTAFHYHKANGLLLAPTFPTSSTELRSGEVYNDAGVLKVVP